MIERTFAATDDTLQDALALTEEELEKVDCPMKVVMQITVCLEEMYVNVAHYAYGDGQGDVTMQLDCAPGSCSIVLIDSGMAFDPLAKADPDITLSAEERGIGGLGIFMVKKSMDEVRYERDGDRNIFYMKKLWTA